MPSSVFIATSLDGYIARLDGGLDWLPGADCEPHGYEEFMASVDAMVIGRHTYETVLGFGGWAYGNKPVIVLSDTLTEIHPPAGADCRLMTGAPAEIVTKLAARGLSQLYVDGGITIQRFLNAGAIERLIVTRIPVLLGRGIPLFGPTSCDILLEHVSTRCFRGGLVQSEYRVKPRAPGDAGL